MGGVIEMSIYSASIYAMHALFRFCIYLPLLPIACFCCGEALLLFMFFMVLVFLGLGAGQPPALSLPADWHASFAALEGTS